MIGFRKSSNIGLAEALALVTELGFAIGVPIAGGAFLGDYLDRRFGGRGIIFIVVFLLGLFAGLYSGYRLVMRVLEETK